jgi:hypothetical protein
MSKSGTVFQNRASVPGMHPQKALHRLNPKFRAVLQLRAIL